MVDLVELGRRIRKLRVERRQTLKQVEQICGLSSTHLSEIERGRTSPTIGALVRIARALDRDASYFIEPDERSDVAYLPREKRTSVPGPVAIEALSPGVPGCHLFPYRVTLDAATGSVWRLSADEIPGEASYFIQSGTLEVRIGNDVRRLQTGDALQASLRFDHTLRAEPGAPVELIALLTHPLHATTPEAARAATLAAAAE